MRTPTKTWSSSSWRPRTGPPNERSPPWRRRPPPRPAAAAAPRLTGRRPSCGRCVISFSHSSSETKDRGSAQGGAGPAPAAACTSLSEGKGHLNLSWRDARPGRAAPGPGWGGWQREQREREKAGAMEARTPLGRPRRRRRTPLCPAARARLGPLGTRNHPTGLCCAPTRVSMSRTHSLSLPLSPLSLLLTRAESRGRVRLRRRLGLGARHPGGAHLPPHPGASGRSNRLHPIHRGRGVPVW